MATQLTVTATEANRNFSSLLDRVKRGEVVDITSHGKTVAELRPKLPRHDSDEARRKAVHELLAHLATVEPVTVGPWNRNDLYDRD